MRIAEGGPTLAPWAAAEALGPDGGGAGGVPGRAAADASGAVGKTGFLRLGFERARRPHDPGRPRSPRAVHGAARAVLRPGDAGPRLALHDHHVGLRAAGRPARARGRARRRERARTSPRSRRRRSTAWTPTTRCRRRSIALADGAYLEFLPDPLIPHRRARFLSDTRISIAPTATLLYSEIVQPGRKHHHPDECFGATLLSLAVEAARPDGRRAVHREAA